MLQQEILNFIKEDIAELKSDIKANKLENAAELKEIKDDIKGLLRFKWQIVGGSILASGLMSFVFQLFLAIMQK